MGLGRFVFDMLRGPAQTVNPAENELTSQVKPLSVRTTAADIVSDQPSATGGTFHYHQVAELHTYVNETITYVPDPRSRNYVAPPTETLETGAGDCDCQAVLVASLLEAIGATTRLVRCQSVGGDWHVLPEVYLTDSGPGAPSEVADSLAEYYADRGSSVDTFSYERNSNRLWYPADTAMGRYVGDIHQLAAEGYVHGPEPDGSWEWNRVEYHYP